MLLEHVCVCVLVGMIFTILTLNKQERERVGGRERNRSCCTCCKPRSRKFTEKVQQTCVRLKVFKCLDVFHSKPCGLHIITLKYSWSHLAKPHSEISICVHSMLDKKQLPSNHSVFNFRQILNLLMVTILLKHNEKRIETMMNIRVNNKVTHFKISTWERSTGLLKCLF